MGPKTILRSYKFLSRSRHGTVGHGTTAQVVSVPEQAAESPEATQVLRVPEHQHAGRRGSRDDNTGNAGS